MKTFLVAALLLLASTGVHAADVALFEGFDDLATSGWTIVNASVPAGSSSWFQGNAAMFPAAMGAPDSYAAADFNSRASSGGTISTWLISPQIDFISQGLSFFARAADAASDDALNVMISVDGASLDLADFALLLAINPGNATGGMPADWTQFATGLLAHGSGRIAFQYTVGPGNHAGYIGVDSVVVVPPVCLASADASGTSGHIARTGPGETISCAPEPASPALVATALVMLLALRTFRKRAFLAG